jgi:hypothetical protein
MSTTGAEISNLVEQLNQRILQLETRVSVLEGEPRKQTPAPSAPVPRLRHARPSETWQGLPSIELPSAISTVGRAVLGMAGAYLFRALAESGTVPKLPVIVLAIAYAAMWMVYAVRRCSNTFVSVAYALTSLLILAPMLWETTVRFEYLSPAATGTILAAFFAFTLAVAWKQRLEAVPWLTVAATAGVALALFVATRDVVSLTASILAMAAIMEAAACYGHALSSRMVPALAANLSVWLVVSLLTSEPFPEGYPHVTPVVMETLWFALPGIYAVSIAIRGFCLRREISLVDTIQGTLAFAVAAFGATRAPGGIVAPVLGLIMLTLAAACYFGTLVRFAEEGCSRNRRILSVWAAALLVLGSIFLLPTGACMVFLCAVAAAAGFLYTRNRNVSLGLHASALLAVAFAQSALPRFAYDSLIGTVPTAWRWSIFLVTGTALLCYVTASSVAEDKIRRRALWAFPALLIALAAASAAVIEIVALSSGRWGISASWLSAVRSTVNCALALTLAFLGLRWRRIELGWLAYAAVAFGTLKLLFEDLPSGNSSTLVFSFLFYGVVLIVLPRLTRRAQTDYLHPKKYFVFSS